MSITPGKINAFLFWKLPSAFLCGVRVKKFEEGTCTTTVKYRWINQNPFNSMYFAVQMMAAELSTGALLVREIKRSGRNFSMLVTGNKSHFTKKATGRIFFTCTDGKIISNAIARAEAEKLPQTLMLRSTGIDAKGDKVSEIEFEWSINYKISQ